MIHLSRCEYDTNANSTDSYSQHKITTNVVYPLEDLDMAPYLLEDMREKGVSYLYDLIGVACHRGSGMGGHYSAICRDNVDGVNKWFRYSDDTVEEVSVKAVRNADAYAWCIQERVIILTQHLILFTIFRITLVFVTNRIGRVSFHYICVFQCMNVLRRVKYTSKYFTFSF